jgi:hypothetical protein
MMDADIELGYRNFTERSNGWRISFGGLMEKFAVVVVDEEEEANSD